MTQLPPLSPHIIDRTRYEEACSIEGYFTTAEADLLIRAIQSAGPQPVYLEVGCFRGRSTMFALSTLPPGGRIVGVDAFVYNHHSPSELRATLNDPRVLILEGTMSGHWSSLSQLRPDVVLIDADHSLAGFCLDLTLAVALLPCGAQVATHDVSDRFPGVQTVVTAFESAGILEAAGCADDLIVWAVRRRPAWLVDPRPEIDWELPEAMGGMVPAIVQLGDPVGARLGRLSP